ncbi:hypothetical protein Mal35_21110 [Gimesia maris]|nr:hypothetical protein Mal35_21110 [Gimesia maris]
MRILLVDDGFDAPVLSEIESTDFDQFIAERNINHGADEDEIQAIVADVESIEDLDVSKLESLWQLRLGNPLLRPQLDALFATRVKSCAAVISIYNTLAAEDGVEKVETDGTNCKYNEQYDLVFLDYRLGTGDKNEAIRNAMNIAQRIHATTGAMVILMSSTDVSVREVTDFRLNANLHQSLFDFIEKSTLSDRNKLLNRLQAFKDTLRSRKAIHDLVGTINGSMTSVAEKVTTAIKALRYEDVTYLHYTTLRADGETLGDYLAWLVTNYSAHQLLAGIGGCEPITQLNEVRTQRLVPFYRQPSDAIAEMYRDAITEIIQRGWQQHPHVDVNSEIQSLPRLQFGDLLYKSEGDPVYLILNAACDLAMAPGQNRGEDPELSILLLPGFFVSLDTPWDKEWGGARTELFEIDGSPNRIRWDYSKVESVSFKHIRKRFESNGFRHERRLTQAYAIEIQQSFSKHLTRVGQQNAPPKLGGITRAKLFFKSEDKKFEFLEEFSEVAACVYHHKDKTTFTLTGVCVEWVYELVSRAIGLIERRYDTNTAREATKRIEELRAVKKGLLPDCGFQIGHTKMPQNGKSVAWPAKTKEVVPLLSVHNAAELSGSWKGEGVVAISICMEPNKSQGDE